jgi:hypothetical protein
VIYHQGVVPIPFRDAADVEDLGTAVFLKIEAVRGGSGYAGALFVVNARGEPVEFAYNRIETPETFLWRDLDLRRLATRKLTASLLTICGRAPRLLFCLADEAGSELFCQDLQLSIPVGRIGAALKATSYAAVETEEVVDEPQPLHLFWFPEPPAADSPERRLFERLRDHGLLLEPFERAAVGLREVYPGALAERVEERSTGRPAVAGGHGYDQGHGRSYGQGHGAASFAGMPAAGTVSARPAPDWPADAQAGWPASEPGLPGEPSEHGEYGEPDEPGERGEGGSR